MILTILPSENRVEGARDFYWVRANYISFAIRYFILDSRVITVLEHTTYAANKDFKTSPLRVHVCYLQSRWKHWVHLKPSK
jgi:hypothetical protein